MVEVKEEPKVSVIMNCLNGARYLSEAIDSVYAQNYDNWEVIFWDNASTDNSAEIAKSYDARVRYFRSDKTFLLGKARNLAFQRAEGQFIALLDCDDIWLPRKLEKQVGLFKKNQELGMTYSNSIFFDAEGDKHDMFQIAKPRRGRVFGDLLASNFISSETMIFRESALDSLDYLFNEEFTMVMDYELTLRLAYLYEMDYIDEPLSKWRMHPGSESNKKRFLIPHEMLRMLEIMVQRKPEISEDFCGEIVQFKKALSYDFALEAWFKGDRQALRRHLKPYLKDHKFLATYLLSLIQSYAGYEKMKPRLRRLLQMRRGSTRST
jgi:glycosyltransferase involved in cell wall biosynthesis